MSFAEITKRALLVVAFALLCVASAIQPYENTGIYIAACVGGAVSLVIWAAILSAILQSKKTSN